MALHETNDEEKPRRTKRRLRPVGLSDQLGMALTLFTCLQRTDSARRDNFEPATTFAQDARCLTRAPRCWNLDALRCAHHHTARHGRGLGLHDSTDDAGALVTPRERPRLSAPGQPNSVSGRSRASNQPAEMLARPNVDSKAALGKDAQHLTHASSAMPND
jgi:hypothetical protein